MGAVKDQLMEVEQFVIDQSCDDITNDEIIAAAKETFGSYIGSYAGEVINELNGQTYDPDYDTVSYEEFVKFINQEIPF